jgi:type I restriction enzyme, S subunit
MANNWKRVKVDFKTVKLGNFIEPIKTTFSDLNDVKYSTVYGVSNTDGICITGKESSKDISKYIVLEKDCFAFNPYRINVGSIGINERGLKGCVSPAYVVFKTYEKLNPYFLFHYLKSDYGNHLINWYGNRGGVRNALRFDDLCQIDIPDIDLPTQLSLLKEIQNYSTTFDNLKQESINQSSCLTKLRQAILQEAIEGKLTADWRKENPVRMGDPDFDAEALLKKIQAEKENLIKEGKIKKQKPLAPIKVEEVPFELPAGWVWCRAPEIKANEQYSLGIGPFGSDLVVSDYSSTGTPLIFVRNITNNDFSLSRKFVSTEKAKSLNAHKVIGGDVLITKMGDPPGDSAIYPNLNEPAIITADCIRLRAHKQISCKYLLYALKSNLVREQILTITRGMGQKKVSLERFIKLFIPLPPRTEQQAIVDRVENLLSMVDELEKQVSERKEQSEQLMQAVLREAFEGKA